MSEPITMLSWVRELGAVAVLGWLVFILGRWGLRRIDRMLDQNQKLIEAFTQAVQSFRSFEDEERRTHEGIMRELRAIREEISETEKRRDGS